MMNNGMKIVLLIALLLYVVSPLDLVPGPVDDMIMILMYAILNRPKAKVIEAENNERAIRDCEM